MNKYSDISAIILSGGKSSRYGQDKCDLLFDGNTFLNNQINKFRDIGIVDIIACGYRGEKCDTKVVEDSILKGPLSGIYFGLKATKNDKAFVVSVDLPLLQKDTIKQIIDYSYTSNSDIVAVKHEERIEPLIAIYKKDLCSKIYELLNGDNYSLMGLFDLCKVDFVEMDKKEQFLNVNYKDDYKKLIGD